MEPITIRGQCFYGGGSRFLINGVAYQLHKNDVPPGEGLGVFGGDAGGVPTRDPLADENLVLLERCLPLFRELELNVLFIYWIDPSRNHDAAMNLLAKAGIYVLVGIFDPFHSIPRHEPLAWYSAANLQHAIRIVDIMSIYTNTLGLFVGCEVVNMAAQTVEVPRVLRAVTRDLKRYMRLCQGETEGEDTRAGGNDDNDGSQASSRIGERGENQAEEECHMGRNSKRRVLPLGYSASDVANVRTPMFQYCAAGPDEEAMDFYALNNYSWLGNVSIQVAGWDRLEQAFHDTPVPVFFSEYGAHNGQPREFHETTKGVYDPSMTDTFSGGVVYEFFWSANRYGLVKLQRLKPTMPQPSPLADVDDGESEVMEGDEGKHAESITVSYGPAAPTAKPERSYSSEPANAGVTEVLQKLPDFENLRKALQRCRHLRTSLSPPPTTTVTAAITRPRPSLPQVSGSWQASPEDVLPTCPLNWDEVEAQIKADWEWVDVGDLVDGSDLGSSGA